MRAVAYDAFGAPPEVRELPEPTPPAHGAVIRVQATGLCRSDWHGWMGHDADIRTLPHVPGHELAGVIEAVGPDVRDWAPGARVTTPFVCACGACGCCRRGEHQVCERQRQPGFTHWGSWAELVAIDWADVNLVAVPDAMDVATAASLGCRFATAWRAVVQVGRVAAGEWVLVAGAGGVGLSAVMIATAAGARVVALDRDPAALALAARVGAEAVTADPDEIPDLTGGGVDLSVDAIGAAPVLAACLEALRRRGRHVQVGLLPDAPRVPIGLLVARELQLLGSHGMAAHHYPALLAQVVAGRLRPGDLITRRIPLEEAPAALVAMRDGSPGGVTIIEPGPGGDRTAAPAPRPG